MNVRSDAPIKPIIFENTAVAQQHRDNFGLGLVFLAIGLAPVVLSFIWPGSVDAEMLQSFVIIGLGLMVLAAYQKFFARKNEQKHVELIFDQTGIGGLNLFDNTDDRLNWKRIQSVDIDGAAVVVRYEPKDMNSNSPVDRRSLVRLHLADHQPAPIATAIKKFWHRAD